MNEKIKEVPKKEVPKKVEVKKEVKKVEKGFDVKAKADLINASKMPEKQKMACLEQIGVINKAKPNGIPFNIYARIRKIPMSMHGAMKVYPKAKGVKLAKIDQWDCIFENFFPKKK